MRILASEPHITIAYDNTTSILYTDWTGQQTKETVIDGCERILYHLQMHQCSKVLNDNTNVESVWLDVSWWVAVDWFPRMQQANCQLFAWVEPPNSLGTLCIKETLKFEIMGINALTFPNRNLAEEWLLGYEEVKQE